MARVTLILKDPGLEEQPAVRAWLDKVETIINQQQDLLMQDLMIFGVAAQINGVRVDPAEFYELPRDSTPA